MMLPRALVNALAIGGACATLALAAPPAPYDFAGEWTGSVMSRGVTAALGVDFVSTPSPRKFTGSTDFADPSGNHVTCDFKATYRRKLTVHLGSCSDGSRQTVTARFDPTTRTLSGSFLVGRHHPRRATFTLVRAAAPGDQ